VIVYLSPLGADILVWRRDLPPGSGNNDFRAAFIILALGAPGVLIAYILGRREQRRRNRQALDEDEGDNDDVLDDSSGHHDDLLDAEKAPAKMSKTRIRKRRSSELLALMAAGLGLFLVGLISRLSLDNTAAGKNQELSEIIIGLIVFALTGTILFLTRDHELVAQRRKGRMR